MMIRVRKDIQVLLSEIPCTAYDIVGKLDLSMRILLTSLDAPSPYHGGTISCGILQSLLLLSTTMMIHLR